MSGRRRIVYRNASGGMGGMIKSVLSALVQCEMDGLEPVVVVEESPYRPAGFVGNVWSLFFESIGDESLASDSEQVVIKYHPLIKRGYVDHNLLQLLHRMMGKYVYPRAEILQRVESYRWWYGNPGRRVGVHYRGSDHHTVYPYLPPRLFVEPLRFLRAGDAYPWLLCTDTAAALGPFSAEPGMIIADVERAPAAPCSHGIHLTAADKLKVGSDAVLDMWLLSKCHAMICRESNLADVATYLNPNMLRITL